jgi:glucose-6-phosphate 1-dehydrogenase
MDEMERSCIVIFGATGDLAEKKLLPALHKFIIDKEFSLPIICCGRKQFSQEEFLDLVGLSDTEETFKKHLHYLQLDFEEPDKEAFLTLAEKLDEEYACKGNFVFYFSLPFSVFEPAIKFIKNSGINKQKGNVKLAFEKPFGDDLKSAKELQKSISSAFTDDQIYLVDHFLGKEFIQNLLVLRFTNRMMDQIWNGNHIDHVQITLAEDFGVDGRGSFYDNTGAIRDVVQNHILQLVALIGMDCPESLVSSEAKELKAAFLSKLCKVDKDKIVIGQYQSGVVDGKKAAGYREEEDVEEDSKTETFVAFRFFVEHPNWEGVPWYVRTGKRLNENRVDIQIVLKKTDKLIESQKNTKIHLSLKPDTEIAIAFNSKEIGKKQRVDTKELDFCFSCLGSVNSPDAYELIFEDILQGDHTIFVSWEEVFESWKFADDLIQKSKELSSRHLNLYPAGSQGPDAAKELIEKDGREWI